MYRTIRILFSLFCLSCFISNGMSQNKLAQFYFGNDSRWYEENIPFIDVPDQEIMDVYYYRWAMYKRHFRDLGSIGSIITEFAPSVSWEGPYSGISAAAGHHIYEGRWIKNRKYIDDYLSFWFNGHGNQFQYSSWLCDALYNYYLVNGNMDRLKAYLPTMLADYEGWKKKRFDPDKGIYWQKPVEDATEFTIAGYMVNDGWAGDAYRPTINTFMYANALAIYEVATICNEKQLAEQYLNEAITLKKNVLDLLWNDDRKHFMDRFTQRYPEQNFAFINDVELNGYVPWMFCLPDNNDIYIQAWKKFKDPEVFYSPFGPRTISKQSPYYMVETRTPGAQAGVGECEWNGPSWPYQTSQILMALSNILNAYNQSVISKEDYFDMLKIYTRSQYKNGKPYIAENLHPDDGSWIADFPNRSEHYNHSTYNDLILSGLLGIHPQAEDSIEINPLIPDEWEYFSVDNLSYHGHMLSLRYEKTNGLMISCNGKKLAEGLKMHKQIIPIPQAKKQEQTAYLLNYAFNNKGEDFPQANASYTYENDRIYDAIDGRTWYDEFPQNRWTTLGSDNPQEWFEINFGERKSINATEISFYDNGSSVLCPQQIRLEYWNGKEWKKIKNCDKLIPGTSNTIHFKEVNTSKFKLVFTKKNAAVGLAEIKVGKWIE